MRERKTGIISFITYMGEGEGGSSKVSIVYSTRKMVPITGRARSFLLF